MNGVRVVPPVLLPLVPAPVDPELAAVPLPPLPLEMLPADVDTPAVVVEPPLAAVVAARPEELVAPGVPLWQPIAAQAMAATKNHLMGASPFLSKRSALSSL